jgi:uncharacterized protein (TIGR03435 family)
MPVPGLAARAALAARTSPAGSDAAADPSGVDLVKSAEKLGLKLEKRKAPIERLIVDHAERVPTEN